MGKSYLHSRLVVAVGIYQFCPCPSTLSAIPGDFMSHNSAHSSLEAFRCRDIAVLGAGAPLLDLAALLHEGDASVHVIARRIRNPLP